MRLLTVILLTGILPLQLLCQTPIQDSALRSFNISDKTLENLNGSYARINASVERQSQNLVANFQAGEAKLAARLQAKDSNAARQIFAGSAAFYQNIQARIQSAGNDPLRSLKSYVPGIDSMQTAIQFLSKTGLSVDQLQRLQAISRQLALLQGNLQNAGQIQQSISQRENLLQSQLSQFGFAKQLTGMDQAVYYYQQQISQYKNILNDRQQQQQLVLSAVRQIPAFQRFWQRNSMLAQLFPQPANAGTLLSGSGLQTSTQVGGLIQQRLGTSVDDGGKNGGQFLQARAAGAQGQMDQLKNKLDRLNTGGGGSSDMALPDFTPNSQRTKTFFRRLQLGFNIQNGGSTPIVPVISTIAVSLGYKLNDNVTTGVGAGYLLGLGNGWNNIQLSSQGASLRSFADFRLKKSIWLTGGFEYNYMQAFTSLKTIRDLSLWQRSALAGLMKTFSAGKHSGNIQLLYDFLAAQEIPQGQPLKIRFGYSL